MSLASLLGLTQEKAPVRASSKSESSGDESRGWVYNPLKGTFSKGGKTISSDEYDQKYGYSSNKKNKTAGGGRGSYGD